MYKIVCIKQGTKELEVKETATMELKVMQNLVGGYIEMPMICHDLYENNIDIVINEEGKLIEGMKPTLAVVDIVEDEDGNETPKVVDVVYGDIFFVGVNREDGETISLTDGQIDIIKRVTDNYCKVNEAEPFYIRAVCL